MKCSKCGKTYDDKLNFCPFCGEKSHVVQDNIEMDNNYGGTLNRILNIITHVGEKTHGFNLEDDSPSFYFCRNFID